jgi:DNA-binding MarR family transcriptional regulator
MASDPVQALRRATQRLVRRLGTLAADQTPCGMPLPMAHAHALMVLAERGPLVQHELGGELGIDKSNVARLAAKLVRAGHATQRVDRADRRRRQVALTDRGARLAATVDAASRARFAAILAAVPARRRAGVVSALHVLSVALVAAPPSSLKRIPDAAPRPRPAVRPRRLRA